MNYLDILQTINNILYEIFSDKDFVIDIQVYINKKRFERNEPDPNNVILYDDGKPFVQ